MVNKRTEIGLYVIAVWGLLFVGRTMLTEEKEMPTVAVTSDHTNRLIEAKKLSEEMIELFADSEGGGFFLTGRDSEKLIARSKPGFDGAIPSGNSIAALVLLKLGRLTMSQDLAERGGGILEAFSS